MPKKQSAGSIIWTGKNLADVRRFHPDVAHYPAGPKDTFPRDASQHPDNLHVDADGHTLIAAIGDTLTKDTEGRITVEQTGKARPVATSGQPGAGRTHAAEGTDAMKGKGGAK
jgi:hypothetical protein